MREVRLSTRPTGLPAPGDFTVAEVPVPVPADGEVLVRTRVFHIPVALRTLIHGGPGLPMPPILPGDALPGLAVGEVVSAAGTLKEGELVRTWQTLGDYAAVPAAACAPLGDALPDPAAHLSQGALAYSALAHDAELRPGDTVFVTSAAGAVGTMAGQIARLLGAGRVVGSTGSPEKARRLVAELGYDAVVLRGAGPVAGQLAEAAPEGVDVLLDNVGGEQLTAAVGAARPGARFVLVGALSGQLDPAGGSTAPAEIDTYRLILRRAVVRAYSGVADQEEWTARLASWLRDDKITFPHVRIKGMENAPRALTDVFAGRHFGTVLVEP